MSTHTLPKNKKSSVVVSLTEKQISTIVQSLLFSSSVNIGANWNETDYTAMVKLATSLRELHPTLDLDKICFYQEENYEDKWSPSILDSFKEYLNIVELQNA